MSTAHEGSRATPEGLLISTCPDVCLTPRGAAMVPVPYSIVAKQNDDAATTQTVHMTTQRTHNMGSLITRCTGDAPGTGKGIKSGTIENICEPKTHSPTVRTEGKFAVRHGDQWWMNNRNTYGTLNYVKDTRPAARVQLAQIAQIAPPLSGGAQFTWPRFLPRLGDRTIDPFIGPMPFAPTEEQMERQLPDHLRPITPEQSTQPSPDPEPGTSPGPGQRPVPGPIPDTRVSRRCRSETICFKGGEYDRKEFDRQLQMQEGAINGKKPEQYLKDVDRFKNTPEGSLHAQAEKPRSDARNAYIAAHRDSFIARYGPAAWDEHMGSLAALHRLDMVAGGDPTDIAGMGNAKINSSIGSQWRWRRDQLDSYAREMRDNGCPMNAKLKRCTPIVA